MEEGQGAELPAATNRLSGAAAVTYLPAACRC
jgi:hypothetical protein